MRTSSSAARFSGRNQAGKTDTSRTEPTGLTGSWGEEVGIGLQCQRSWPGPGYDAMDRMRRRDFFLFGCKPSETTAHRSVVAWLRRETFWIRTEQVATLAQSSAGHGIFVLASVASGVWRRMQPQCLRERYANVEQTGNGAWSTAATARIWGETW